MISYCSCCWNCGC